MGQNRFYIIFSPQFLIGIKFEKGFKFELHIIFLIFGIGLTDSAKGFNLFDHYKNIMKNYKNNKG